MDLYKNSKIIKLKVDRYYLKAVFRNLQGNKKFSWINITGFAFAISVCLAIFLFIAKEHSFDKYNENSEYIVRLTDVKNNTNLIDYRVKDILLRNYPEFRNACIVQRVNHPVAVRIGDKGFYLDDILSVDNSFFKMFSIRFKTGRSGMPFDNINSVILTETTARKLFGNDNPLGKDLLIWGNLPVTVSGIINDFPENSSISAGILVNADNDKFKFTKWIGDSRDLNTYQWPFHIYCLLNKNIDPGVLLARVNSNTGLLKPYNENLGFVKMKDVYLHDPVSGSETKQGNAGLLNLLTGIAIIILILSVINYINLTVAQQSKRNKNAGIRKTIGSDRFDIFLNFMLESVLITFIAFILGLIIVWLIVPFYQSLFNTKLDLGMMIRFPWILILTGSIIVIGLISGCGPAIVFSRVSPIKVITGTATSPGRKKYFRNSLIVFQFTISIILIFCVTIVFRQIRLVKHRDAGFIKENLLKLDLPDITPGDSMKARIFLDFLQKSLYISKITVTSGSPGEVRNSMGTNFENTDKNMSVPCILADTSFLETFGIKIIRGRNLEPGDFGKVCMINETAYKQFDFNNLDNKRFNNFGGFDIIAVVNDFQFTSFHKIIGPLCIMFTPKHWNTTINIRFAVNSSGPGLDIINKYWNEIMTGYPLRYQFYDDWFNSMYRKEERFATTIGLFAFLAIVISCLGMFGLAVFTSELRSKEIGIRKVNGASLSEVMLLLNIDIIKLVGIAFLISIPVALYSMNKWLQVFAYKTTLNWWIFGLAGVIALLIALLSVSWQSWRAATRNPVEALRYE